jgi:fatty-acyl-CoA synthase
MLTGGAPVPERLIGEYLDRGVTLLQGYGLSEAAPLVLLLDPASSLSKIGFAGRRPLLVDIPVVAADGTMVGAGETGELLVRGANVMAGYWNQPEATGRVMTPTGWLRTGDAACIDEQGYVWIVDRSRTGSSQPASLSTLQKWNGCWSAIRRSPMPVSTYWRR